MKVLTVRDIWIYAKLNVQHNLPDLGPLGPPLTTGIHGRVFAYGSGLILKLGTKKHKAKMLAMLPWLSANAKHLAEITDFGDLGTGYWYLMERIPLRLTESEVLALAQRADGPANMAEFYRWLDGIEYRHTDIKPANVRKTHDGTIKLIDLESFEPKQ